MANFRSGVALTELAPDEVRAFQQLLVRLGFNPGPVDGVAGSQTIGAYKRFLDENGSKSDPNGPIESTMSSLNGGDPDAWSIIHQGTELNVAQQQAAAAPAAASSGAPAAPYSPPAQPPSAAATPNPIPSDDEIRQQFPNLAYLLDNPEIGPILRQATQLGWDAGRLQGAVYSTQWWQTTAPTMRLWDNKKAQDPAAANAEINQKTVEITNSLARYGIGGIGDTDMRWLAEKMLREGFTDDQTLAFYAGLARDGSHPVTEGKITEEEAKIRATSRNYMTNMDDKTVRDWALRIVQGSASSDAVESHLRGEAQNRFYWLKDQISGGLTPDQLFASTRQSVAQMLEIDPETINFNDPKWSELVSPVVDKDTKATRSMNFTEAQKWARSQTEWRRTGNAWEASSQIALSLAKEFGVVG